MEVKKRILCVDDEPQNLELLKAILEPRGYEVIAASNGIEALARVADSRVNLVLLDIMMPELNGYDTCAKIRENERYGTLPVVFITALSSQKDRIKGIESGADDFISKPFDKEDVLAKVRVLLKKREFEEIKMHNMEVKKRILCADDDPQNLELLKAILEPRGYEVVTASSGIEALARVTDSRVNLVLLDVMMPELNGFDTCAKIKEHEQYHSLPVVLITALSAKIHRIRGIESGADDFISKPFDKEEVLARVRMLLKKREFDEITRHNKEDVRTRVRVLLKKRESVKQG